jgi:hypothetical protein
LFVDNADAVLEGLQAYGWNALGEIEMKGRDIEEG